MTNEQKAKAWDILKEGFKDVMNDDKKGTEARIQAAVLAALMETMEEDPTLYEEVEGDGIQP